MIECTAFKFTLFTLFTLFTIYNVLKLMGNLLFFLEMKSLIYYSEIYIGCLNFEYAFLMLTHYEQISLKAIGNFLTAKDQEEIYTQHSLF